MDQVAIEFFDVIRFLFMQIAWEQVAIVFTGGSAIWLSQDTRIDFRKWASVLGLLGQPLWFYTAYKSGQWGIFALCFWYTYAWARGFYNHWVRK